MHYYMAKNDYRSTNTLLQNSNRKPDNIKYDFNIPHNVFKILIKYNSCRRVNSKHINCSNTYNNCVTILRELIQFFITYTYMYI